MENRGDLAKAEMCLHRYFEQIIHSTIPVPKQMMVKILSIVIARQLYNCVCTKELFLAFTLSYLRV